MAFTIQQLFQSTLRLNKNRANPDPSPDIRIEKIIPFAGVRSCLFQVSMRGVTQKNVRHRVTILATDIDVLREDPQNSLKYFPFEDKDGKYWIEKPDPRTTKVRIRCSCLDAYFTWTLWNYINDTAFGSKPRPYVRKTTYYPERNPNHYFGISKHEIWAIKFLESKGFWI